MALPHYDAAQLVALSVRTHKPQAYGDTPADALSRECFDLWWSEQQAGGAK